MMDQQSCNATRLLTFWHDEQNAPRWLVDSLGSRAISEQEFLSFCENCWNIYDLGNALLYVERRGEDICEIHFSILRGSEINMDALKITKCELLQHFNKIFGWVHSRNKGLQQVCEALGLRFNGVKLLEGGEKVITWKCFMLDSRD